MGYRKNLSEVFEYFKNMPNFSLAGRVGAFKYMAIDECMEDSAALARKLKNQDTI
jgi:UDP-galactopyranose mutase